jgi:hypothetical protein
MDVDIALLLGLDAIYGSIIGGSLFFKPINMASKHSINVRELIRVTPKPEIKEAAFEMYRVEVPLKPGCIVDVSIPTGFDSPFVLISICTEIQDVNSHILKISGRTVTVSVMTEVSAIQGSAILFVEARPNAGMRVLA